MIFNITTLQPKLSLPNKAVTLAYQRNSDEGGTMTGGRSIAASPDTISGDDDWLSFF